MADSISAIPANPYIKSIADFLRYLQEEDQAEAMPTKASPFHWAAKLLFPQASTVENLAYGNSPFTMAPEGTGSRIPIVKTGRKGEVADIIGTVTGGIPGAKLGSEIATTGVNKLSDLLVQGVTKNPSATAMGVLDEAGQMVPLSRIFIGPKSAAWNKEAAAKAAEMEKAGKSAKEIWEETMTARGLDKQWRQEISDQLAMLDMSKLPQKKQVQDLMADILQEQGIKVDPTKPLSQQIGNERWDQIYEQARDRFLEQKSSVRLPYAFKHDQLEEAYPNLVNNLRVEKELSDSYRGKFSPSTKTVSTGGAEWPGMEAAEKQRQAQSTLLHEIQHAIQDVENWGRGGSPESAKMIASAQIKSELAPLVEPFTRNRYYWDKYGEAGRADYMITLKELSNRSGIKPRAIYSLNDWYRYGNEYRSLAGPQPKKPGELRDKWFQNAAEYIREQNLKNDPKYQDLPFESRREAQNAKKRALTQIKKTSEATEQYQALKAKDRRFMEMTDQEAYRRLAGEAESRLTQAREGLSMRARRANFPFAEQYEKPIYGTSDKPAPYGAKETVNPYGLDVPAEETIAYTQFGTGYDDPLTRFLQITEPAYDPLVRFVGSLGK